MAQVSSWIKNQLLEKLTKSEPLVREGDRTFICYDAIEISHMKAPRHGVVAVFKYQNKTVFELPSNVSLSNGQTLHLTGIEGRAGVTLSVDGEDQPDPPSAEQKARDLLARMDLDAGAFTAGDLGELANLISEVEYLREKWWGR